MSLLEMAAAAGRTARDDSVPRPVAVLDATLAAPALPATAGGRTVLECCISQQSSSVEITSCSAAGQAAAQHLTARLAATAVRCAQMSFESLPHRSDSEVPV